MGYADELFVLSGGVTEKMFDSVLNLNLKGPFRLSALAGERMAAAGSGSIVTSAPPGRSAHARPSSPMRLRRPV